MNKKIILLILLLIFCTTTTLAATANVQISGDVIDFTDSDGNKVDAQIINSRTMVPLRKIFEILGCNIEWDGTTRTVTAANNETKLILQIDNKVARKVVDGTETKITLDTAPTIYNNRTLVPLRFIAESLDKQVGWDAQNATAIIIDYEYFEKDLKNRVPMLYELVSSNYNNFDIEITRDYVDNADNKNNNTAIVKATVSRAGKEYNVQLNFSGNNDLMREIAEEKWNNIDLKLDYDKNYVRYQTTNETLAKMLGTPVNTKKDVNYKELSLTGSESDDVSDVIENILNLNENSLNINSFKVINAEWNRIINSISYKTLNDTAQMNISSIHALDTNYFDFTKMDNILYGNAINKIYNVINKEIFRYDVTLNELLYDMSNISINGSLTNYGKSATIEYTASNEYDEKISYNIKLNIN